MNTSIITAPARYGGASALLLGILFFCSSNAQTFVHPGAMHKQADFDRMSAQVAAHKEPWLSGWNALLANSHSSSSYITRGPVDTVYRGTGTPENYMKLAQDIAAAYANALRWKVAGTVACADKAVAILNAWSSLKYISGTSDKYLASGLYGYEIANVAEIMRDYSGWSANAFNAFKNMMLAVFYPMNHAFLVNHNNACITHYWANWDLCNMASAMAIGILCDDTAKFNEAVTYFKAGAGNGAIEHAVYQLYGDSLGQWQESGRDQGHNTLGVALMGPVCEMAWNQGVDLYGYDNNRFLAACEYIAKYNLGGNVPYTTYNNCDNVNQTVISVTGRGIKRDCWEMVYNHYVNRMGIPAPYTTLFADSVRPEGGGGHYDPNSGGYDQLGYGTLTYSFVSATLLPTVWNSFHVKCLNNTVVTGWTTQQEANTLSFTVQRSSDGIAWTNIARVAAAGYSSTAINYSYTDKQPGPSSFYRIVKTDANGSQLFSPVMRTDCTGSARLSVYPNPISDNAWIVLNATATTTVNLHLYDGIGRLIQQQERTLQAGANYFQLTTAQLARGIYHLHGFWPNGSSSTINLEKD